MSLSLPGGASVPATAPRTRPSRDAILRAVWRLHFYAGLISLPFLVLLAGTGALYLFKAEIDRTVFATRTVVPPSERPPLGPDRLVYIATQAVPDAVPVAYLDPPDEQRSALVTMREGDRKVLVYLNPFTGDVLDRVPAESEFMAVVRGLHSLSTFGPVANGVIEAVAGFLVILVVTGTVLWWPRGGMQVRGTRGMRVWWRDLHAVTGIVAGAGLLFLALTGLPWSVVWGQQFRSLANQAGLGQPRALWADKAVSTVPVGELVGTAGWTMEDAPVPLSQPAGTAPIGLDRAAAILRAQGMPRGYEVALPVGEAGVYAAAVYPRDVGQQRLISLDQYSGHPVLDVRFSDLGLVGKGIQLGIGLHKGEYFGRANQLLMLALCLAALLLSASAAVMWWKRRPVRGLGVPPWPGDGRAIRLATGLVLGLGLLFPLTGAAILAMIGLDALVIRARRHVPGRAMA